MSKHHWIYAVLLVMLTGTLFGLEEGGLFLEAQAEVLDGGVYYLDESYPLNGFNVGITIRNTARASERFEHDFEANNGLAYVLKVLDPNELNVAKMLEISEDVSFEVDPSSPEGPDVDELKDRLNVAKHAERKGVRPDEMSVDDSEIWVKWVRASESLNDFWRLGIPIKIPEASPVQFIDFKIVRQLTADDDKVGEAMMKLNDKMTAFSTKRDKVFVDPKDLIPDVIVRRIDSFDSVAPLGFNVDGYLDAGEESDRISVNVGRYYNFTRPGTYTVTGTLYGSAEEGTNAGQDTSKNSSLKVIRAGTEMSIRVLPFRKTNLTFTELKKEVNERPSGTPVYPWMFYEILAEDGIREVVYSQRRFRIDGQSEHDFYRLCRVMPGVEIKVGEAGLYRGVVYTQSYDGVYVYAEINFDYRYPLVTFSVMEGKDNIPRDVSPDGELDPSLD